MIIDLDDIIVIIIVKVLINEIVDINLRIIAGIRVETLRLFIILDIMEVKFWYTYKIRFIKFENSNFKITDILERKILSNLFY